MQAERIELEPRTIVGVHEVIPLNAMIEFFDRAFTGAFAELTNHGASPVGPPIALYHGAPTDTVDVTAGFPVAQPWSQSSGIVAVSLPGGAAIETTHVGPYDTMTETYQQLTEWMKAQKLIPAVDMWEEYLVGPDTEPDPAKWRTRIVYPLAS
jgi:effector-binding domain-containing protein